MNESVMRALAPLRPHLRRWLAPWRALWLDLAGAWRLAIARSPELSDAALRDIGLSRCELQSYLAEVDGRAAATRRRVAERRNSQQ